MTFPSHPGSAPPVANPAGATPVRPTHGGGAATGGVSLPTDPHYDPAGNPIRFDSASVRDQQAGGDMTGRNPDRRDDNFRADTVADASRQLRRDVEVNDGLAGAALPEAGQHRPPDSHKVEPDGTEDPLANIDDGLLNADPGNAGKGGAGNAPDQAPKKPPGTPDDKTSGS